MSKDVHKMNSKKGAILFSILLVVFMVFILLHAWSLLTSKYRIFDRNIGQRQYDLINIYQKAEKALFYVDQSAKYSAYLTILDLADKGGYYDKTNCGVFKGASIWISAEEDTNELKVKECYPSDKQIIENFLKFFGEKLSLYLANYPDVAIPSLYNYAIGGNLEIVGEATENLVIDIAPEDFVAKPIQVVAGEIPPLLRAPMKSTPDIETIKQFHPEVWEKYTKVCEEMGSKPAICKTTPTKCCITSAYRHPAYNKKEGGARNSAHQYGVALDINVGRGMKQQISSANIADDLFTRVGIYPRSSHIHIDTMPPKGDFKAIYWIGDKGETIATASNLNQLEIEARKRGFT